MLNSSLAACLSAAVVETNWSGVSVLEDCRHACNLGSEELILTRAVPLALERLHAGSR